MGNKTNLQTTKFQMRTFQVLAILACAAIGAQAELNPELNGCEERDRDGNCIEDNVEGDRRLEKSEEGNFDHCEKGDIRCYESGGYYNGGDRNLRRRRDSNRNDSNTQRSSTGGGRDLRRTDKRRNGSNTQGSNTGGGRDLKKGPNDNRKDSYTESPKNRSENAYEGGNRRLREV